MEKFGKLNIAGTPLNPIPQHILYRKLPVVPPIRKALYGPNMAVSISSRPPKEEIVNKDLLNSKQQMNQKLPILSSKNKNTNKSVSYGKYSKWTPKFFRIKPLFHGRNRSYNMSPDDDEEYTALKNKISWLDYLDTTGNLEVV